MSRTSPGPETWRALITGTPRRRSTVPLILSGGLNPGNVERAIALTRPSVVDTASGTESAPGRKDPNKLRAFFDAVNRTTIGPARIGQPA